MANEKSTDVPCPTCGKRFRKNRLKMHQTACRGTPGGTPAAPPRQDDDEQAPAAKPTRKRDAPPPAREPFNPLPDV